MNLPSKSRTGPTSSSSSSHFDPALSISPPLSNGSSNSKSALIEENGNHSINGDDKPAELKVVVCGTKWTHHALITARREGGTVKQQRAVGTYRWYRLRPLTHEIAAGGDASPSASTPSVSPSPAPLVSPETPSASASASASASSHPSSPPVLVKESLESDDCTYECHLDDIDAIIACQFLLPDATTNALPPSTSSPSLSSTPFCSSLTSYGLIIPDPLLQSISLSKDHYTVLGDKEELLFLTMKRTKLLISNNEEEVIMKFPFHRLQFHLSGYDSTQFRLVERKEKKTVLSFRGISDSVRGRDMIGLMIRHKKRELGVLKRVIFSPPSSLAFIRSKHSISLTSVDGPPGGVPPTSSQRAVTPDQPDSTALVTDAEGHQSKNGRKEGGGESEIGEKGIGEKNADMELDADADEAEGEADAEIEPEMTETGGTDLGYHADLKDELRHLLALNRMHESVYLEEHQRDIAQLRLSKQKSSDEIQLLKEKNQMLTDQLTRLNIIPGLFDTNGGNGSETDKLKSRVKQLTEVEKQLRAEVAKLQLALNQTRAVALGVEKMEAEQEKLTKDLEQQVKAYSDLEVKYQKLQKLESDFEAREMELREIRRARAEYDRERREKESLRSSLAELTAQNGALQSQLLQITQFHQAAESTNASLQQRHVAMEAKVSEYKAHEDELIANRNYLKKKADSLSQQMERLLRERNVDVDLLKHPSAASASMAFAQAVGMPTRGGKSKLTAGGGEDLTSSGSSTASNSGDEEELAAVCNKLRQQNKQLTSELQDYKKQFGSLKPISVHTGNSLLDKVVNTVANAATSAHREIVHEKAIKKATPPKLNGAVAVGGAAGGSTPIPQKHLNVQVSPSTSLTKDSATKLQKNLSRALAHTSSTASSSPAAASPLSSPPEMGPRFSSAAASSSSEMGPRSVSTPSSSFGALINKLKSKD